MDKEKVIKYLDKTIIGSLMFMMFNSAISIAGSSIGLGFAFLGWIFKIIITREIKFKGNPLNKPIIIFLLAMIISFIGSYDVMESIKEIERFLWVFILYYLIIDNVADLKTIKRLFAMGLVSITISSLYGLIWQHFYLGVSRVDSTFMALDFGALLLVYLLFAIVYFFFESDNVKERFKYGLLIPIIFLTLVFNESRGAWLGLLGGSFSIFWIYKKKWIPILLILAVLVVLVAPDQIQSRIESITDLKNNRSNLGRLALWKGAILILEDYPINGIGLGNFKEVYMSQYKQPNTVANSHAHNNYLHYLAETGVIGFVAFIYLLYAILKCLYSSYLIIKPGFSKLFVLSTLGVVIGVFVIQGFTETNFPRAVVGRTIWFMIALSVIITKLVEKKNAEVQ